MNPEPQDNINQVSDPQSKLNLTKKDKVKKTKTTHTIVKKEPEQDEDLVYERIKNSRFKQQNLPAWRPVPTILTIVIVFAFFGIFMIILGIVLLVYSSKIKTAEVDYTDCNINLYCNKKITIEDDIDAPVFIYYQLDGFYQNARRYIRSKEMDQLTGDDIKKHDNCEPAEKNKDMGFPTNKTALDGSDLDDNSFAIPCGLMAKTFFNDSYTFKIVNVE